MNMPPNILGRVYPYLNFKLKNQFLWDSYYNKLPEPKLKNRITSTPEVTNEIIAELKKNNFTIKDYQIDVDDYKQYLKKANYQQFPYHKGGRSKNFPEKSLEHYLGAKLLELSGDDVYVDIANGDSPTPEIYNALYGCDTYSQDLVYPQGVHEKIIGGDACNLPLADSFFTKIGLHCSFEHFEHNADIVFIKEANRVLRHRGRLCILPLYLFNEYAIQTNPVCVPNSFSFERNATLYCVKQWQVHYSRFYDVPHLVERVRNNLEQLDMTIYVIKNEKDVDESCYVKYAAVFEKT